VFARHGLGYSALGIDGTVFTGTRYDAAYDLPPDLQPKRNPAITSNPLTIHVGNGDIYKYTVAASNPAGGTLSYALSKGPAGMTVDSTAGAVVWTAGFVAQRVKITVTDGQGGKVVHGYALPVVTILNAGVSITVSGDQYSTGLALINVPQNTPVFQAKMRGGTGDGDLEVVNSVGLAGYGGLEGNTETLSFPNPRSGIWAVYVLAYQAYSGVSLTGSLITPALLGPNSTMSGLSGDDTSETFYRITVPPGADSLTVSTTGGTGDVDLYLQKGSAPTCAINVLAPCVFDDLSENDGNQESIRVNNPAAADYYINLYGYDVYSGVTLNVVTTFPALTLGTGGVARTTTTDAGNTINAGYAVASVGSGNAPFATAVYSLLQNGAVVSEAGIPASPPTQTARIFIDFRTGVAAGTGTIDVRTGLAIVNPGTTAANLSFTLRDSSGQTIASGQGTLPAGAHRAKFIDELNTIAPNFSLPANFSTSTLYASLEISSSQPVSVLALRLTINQRGDTLLTSTPIADLSRPQSASNIYFPQLADGGGFITSLVLLNTSASTETGTISLFNDDGSALSLQAAGGAAASGFQYSIPASGFFVFKTAGSGNSTQAGWVRVAPSSGNAPVGAGIFSYSPQGILVTDSGVPSVLPTTKARIYVDKSNGHDTGIALANPGNAGANISISAFQTDGIVSVGTSTPLPIASNGHKAAFAGQLVSGLPANFTGVVEITSATPFAALTLRSLTNSRNDTLLTTFPVADETQSAPSPIIFPQIADGAGFSTQFIFISAGSAASVNVTFDGDDGSPLTLGRTP